MEKLKLYYDVNFVVFPINRFLMRTIPENSGPMMGLNIYGRVLALNNKFTYIKDNESNTITIN